MFEKSASFSVHFKTRHYSSTKVLLRYPKICVILLGWPEGGGTGSIDFTSRGREDKRKQGVGTLAYHDVDVEMLHDSG